MSSILKNGYQINPTSIKSTIWRSPPASELVAIIPLKNIGTVQGTDTPVGAGTIPMAITK